jgi:hypothetical protein
MNLAHRWLCRSAYWRNAVETYIFAWVLDGLDIGANVLEVDHGSSSGTRRAPHLRGNRSRLCRFSLTPDERPQCHRSPARCHGHVLPGRDIRWGAEFHYASSCHVGLYFYDLLIEALTPVHLSLPTACAVGWILSTLQGSLTLPFSSHAQP